MTCIPIEYYQILADNSYVDNNGLTFLLSFLLLGDSQTYISLT